MISSNTLCKKTYHYSFYGLINVLTLLGVEKEVLYTVIIFVLHASKNICTLWTEFNLDCYLEKFEKFEQVWTDLDRFGQVCQIEIWILIWASMTKSAN